MNVENKDLAIQNWLDKLKIALIQENENAAFSLASELPEGLDSQNLELKLQARELILQAKQLLEKNKIQTRIHMEHIKAAKKFLEYQ